MTEHNIETDLAAELSVIRDQRNAARKKRYSRSRLDRHRAELVQLHHAGGSLADLQLWLRKYKRTKVARSTIHRFLQKCPEATRREEG